MDRPVVDSQALVGVAANLDASFLDQDGDLVTAVGTVTVDVTRADGTTIATGAATTSPATGVYRYALSAANNTRLDVLTLTWKDGAATRLTTQVEIVGSYYFTVAELRAFDTTLADASKYPAADIVVVRNEVEDEFEDITGVAWVPRYARIRMAGSGTSTLVLPVWAPRTIRSVRDYATDGSYTSFTSTEITALDLDDSGVVVRTDGKRWRAGYENLVVEVEHGVNRPPADLLRAAKQRARYRLNMEKTRSRDTAVRMTVDGATYEMADGDDIEQRQVMRVVRRYEKPSMTRMGIA